MSNDEVIEVLNDLIETSTDGQERFHVAAEKVSNNEFCRLFNIFSQQRAQFISELQEEVHRLGGSQRDNGSTARILHRARTSIESAVAQGGEVAVTAECQRGQEAAINNYQEVLKAELPLDVQYVVKRQYMDIKDAFDRLRILHRAA